MKQNRTPEKCFPAKCESVTIVHGFTDLQPGIIRNRLNAVLKMCTTVVELVGGFNRKAIAKIPVDRKDIKSTYKSHLKVVLNFTVFTLDLSQKAEKRCTLQFLKL